MGDMSNQRFFENFDTRQEHSSLPPVQHRMKNNSCKLFARGLAVATVFLSLACSSLLAGAPSLETRPEPLMEAYDQLLSAKVFAFGGVGFAGVLSEGEKAFHIVAGSTNALDLFKAAVENGTPEARMYALCGIRKLAPDKVDAYAKPLQSANPTVVTMSGCLGSEEAASNVVTRIVAGSYDWRIGNSQMR